jgi:hypothetical protein
MFTQPQKQRTESAGITAPLKGIIATGAYQGGGLGVGAEGSGAAAEGDMGVESAIWLYNMIPGEYGCRIRPGSRDFAIDIPDSFGPNGEVRTILYYNSIISGVIQDHIFAVTDQGIHDITAGGAGPWDLTGASEQIWPNQAGPAGWCTSLNYTNVAGDHWLLLCDEANGYWIFDGTAWATGTFTGSPTPLAANLVQIVEWNGRIWFVERDTARAWFLDPLALEGTITPMDVGNRLKDGGHLVQISTWTVDDGDGIDDKMVMISAAGDVLVWQGIDPTTAADLLLVGRWTVGTVPEGRKLMSDWGGDVLILSTAGLITVSALMSGVSTLNNEKYLSRNINQYIRLEMRNSLEQFGWSIELVPSDGIAIVTIPQPTGTTRAPIQFVLETTTNSWCMFRDLDMVCQTRVGAQLQFGTSDGRVMLLQGTLDNALLDGSSAEAIDFSMLTHYSGLGEASTWKRPQFIRPYWVGDSQPAFHIQVMFDFDLGEILTAPAYTETGLAEWDAAIWDADIWAGTAQSYLETIALSGMGRHLAVAIRGNSTNLLTYVGADVMFQKGGML